MGGDSVSVLDHAPNVLLTYLLDGEEGLAEMADRLHRKAHDQPERKFSKRDALYLPQTPFPPLLWRNTCGRCRFWREGGPGQAGQCHIVGRKDDRFGGQRIHPRGWCGLWMPPQGEPAFAWLREQLNPDGASAVRGRYKPWLATRRKREKTTEGTTIEITSGGDSDDD